MKIYLPQGASRILSALKQNGFEAHIVGGCVRDMLLGQTPHDYDICTSALPEQVLKCFSKNKTLSVGLKHGTITVLDNNIPYEVTTYRTDGTYTDGRHPDSVRFVHSLQEDLSRRDFTVNAMAYSPDNGLSDFFGGRDDLQNKIIRCVGNPDLRFHEDALRILRALRFSSVLGFEIEESTARAIHENKNLLEHISPERIRDELLKLLCGKNCKSILLEYFDVLSVFIPEILPCVGFEQNNPHHCFDVWTHTVHAVECSPPDPIIRLVMLLHDLAKPLCHSIDNAGISHFKGHWVKGADMADDILHRLHFDNKTIQTAVLLIRYHDERPKDKPAVKKLLSKVGKEYFSLLLEVKRADDMAKNPRTICGQLSYIQGLSDCRDEILAAEDCLSLSDLAVNGKDLIALGISPGREMGKILDRLLDAVLNDKVKNEKSALLAIVDSIRKA